MVKHLDVAILFFIFSLTSALSAQSVKNSFDSEGKRHGAWRKNFDKTNQPRYEGEFDHGKEIGLFKFYTLNKGKSVLSATKQFNKENDNAEVKFFSSSGKLISEGQMDGKLYIGQWTFYHNKSSAVMSKETYNNSGQLEGEKTVYYPSGQIAETSHYHNGKLNGQTLTYSENGQLLNDFQYEDNELQGAAKYYDADGHLASEGQYQHDRKHGVWTYYKNDQFLETIDHTRRSKNPKK